MCIRDSVKNEFGYSVHYFYDGTEDTSKLETGVKTFGETIGYTDKVIDGYRLDYTDPASGEITISSKADENVINEMCIRDR